MVGKAGEKDLQTLRAVRWSSHTTLMKIERVFQRASQGWEEIGTSGPWWKCCPVQGNHTVIRRKRCGPSRVPEDPVCKNRGHQGVQEFVVGLRREHRNIELLAGLYTAAFAQICVEFWEFWRKVTTEKFACKPENQEPITMQPILGLENLERDRLLGWSIPSARSQLNSPQSMVVCDSNCWNSVYNHKSCVRCSDSSYCGPGCHISVSFTS